MKRINLYIKFLLTYLVFGLICFGLVALFSSRLSYRVVVTGTASQLYEEAMSLADTYSDVYKDGQLTEDFRKQLDGLAEYTNVRIWFTNADGSIAYDSSEANDLTGTRIPDFDPAESSSYYRVGRFYDTINHDVLSVLAPVTANQTTYGYVIIHVNNAKIAATADRMLIPLYITLALIFLLAFVIMILLGFDVIRPLKEITVAAGEYASGNFRHKIRLHRQDEIGRLADTMNVMAEELATADDYQKKFISNVSHDFRSPLTSIRGYLNAMLDGVIPPESQEKYLRIVINETDRLTTLTQSMLSLNSLNRNNLSLELADFDICHMIKQVCATFEGKCQLKGITFDLILSSAEIFVHADMGKIQQVIYNLVDNAIKFSGDDSDIRISVTQLNAKAAISIKDYGIGISKADQKQIFTRFFKGDRSRGRDKQGTGLGLSIVKEIITAHGETIDVISTEGVGTEFIFRLPLTHPGQDSKEA